MEHKKYHRKISSTKAPKRFKYHNRYPVVSILHGLSQTQNTKFNNNTSLDLLHVGHVRNATNNTDYS